MAAFCAAHDVNKVAGDGLAILVAVPLPQAVSAVHEVQRPMAKAGFPERRPVWLRLRTELAILQQTTVEYYAFLPALNPSKGRCIVSGCARPSDLP